MAEEEDFKLCYRGGTYLKFSKFSECHKQDSSTWYLVVDTVKLFQRNNNKKQKRQMKLKYFELG